MRAAPAPNPWGLSARAHRLVRGWGVASVATFLGAGSHAAVSGHVPGLALILLCWSLSGLLCVLLGGLRLRQASTAAGVLVSQAVLHGVLALGGGHGGHDASAHLATAHLATAHAGHLGHGLPAASAAAGGAEALHPSLSDAASSASPTMLAVHLLAAMATYAAIRRGDTALSGIVGALALAARDLRRLLKAPSVLPVPRLPRGPVLSSVRVLFSRAYPGPVAVRGPPLPLCG